jgi:disulfide bond formation protein DsbB
MSFTRADRLHVYIAVLSLAAVGIALISQHVFEMQPCAWCVLQRMAFVALAIVCLLGVLLRRVPLLPRFISLIALLLAGSGVAAAFYQHNYASKMLTCAQTFADRFVSGTKLDAMLPDVFAIQATCADSAVDLLGYRYELWSMALFALLSLFALVALLSRND